MYRATFPFWLVMCVLSGCQGESPSMKPPSFQLTVEEVFYIKSPVDRVILVGTIQDGTVQTGENATIQSKSGPISIVVEGIEAFREGEIKRASKGQQVGLRVRGITKDQASKGDRVIGKIGE
jgi:translation elongation factor EF-Tu-like GTPase